MSDFRHVASGWFRDASVPKGEAAPMLHGDAAMEHFRAQLAEARAVLRMVEWGKDGVCEVCRADVNDGHAPDCRLAKELEPKAI